MGDPKTKATILWNHIGTLKPSPIKNVELLVFNLTVPRNFLSLRLADKVREMEQAIREGGWEIGEVAIQKGFHTEYLRYLEDFLNSDKPSRAGLLKLETLDLEERL